MKENKKHVCFTKKDRDRIELWYYQGIKPALIARRLGFHKSSIGRELLRGIDAQGIYRAVYADKKAVRRIRSRVLGKRKICKNPALQGFVHQKLTLAWSPMQIAHKLKELYTKQYMHISHEAIYQYIYVLPRGTLKKTLIEGLRQSRKYRRSPRKEKQDQEMRGKIKDMLSIHERPLEVADRVIPGHWEGDLIIGKYKRSAIATLVERTTRYTKLVALPQGKDAVSVRQALQATLTKLPAQLVKTLTYDQGKEMSQHKQFTIDTGIQVYFADPASPWQRSTNENTNGLIRQFFPKGTDFSLVSPEELQYVEDLLNGRPRKCLGFAFPKEKFYDLVALDS
jgi:transposase, IS30 family